MTDATQELERGRLAKDVLENVVYQEAIAQLREEVVRQWQNESDPKTRDWLWTMAQAVKRLDRILAETMQTGTLRAKQVEQQRSRIDRLKDSFRN